MYLNTNYGLVPVKVLRFRTFYKGPISRIEVQLPEGSVPETRWVDVADPCGRTLESEGGSTVLQLHEDEPFNGTVEKLLELGAINAHEEDRNSNGGW